MILELYHRPLEMEEDCGWEDAAPLDLRVKRKVDTPSGAESGHCARTGRQLAGQLEDGKDMEQCQCGARSPKVEYCPPLTASAHRQRPYGYPPSPLHSRGLDTAGTLHLTQGEVLNGHPPGACGSALHPMGLPEEKPELWTSQERSVCPVPTGTTSPHLGDRAGFQSPKTLSPLGVPRDNPSPNQEPAGSHRTMGAGEVEAWPGPRVVDKSQAFLPLRKRRYAMQATEGAPLPAHTPPKVKVECSGPDEAETPACLQQPVPLTNGCAHPGQYLCLRPSACYPGPLQRHGPLYPYASHPLGQGSLMGIHATHYQPFYPLESQLTNDIALASRQDEDGDTALHIAVAQGNLLAIERLICLFRQGQKNIDTFNNLRQTPLHLAVITKQPEVVRWLLCHQASPMALDRNGQTPAHLACEHSSLPCLQELMDQPQEAVDLETRNYEGFTPLHVAVASSDPEMVLFLLRRGADIDAVDIKSGRSPLTHAVENNSPHMVSLLLKNGANVNSQTYSGNTALHSASGRGLLELVRVLLKNGADSSIKNYHNDTPLMVASNKKVMDILRGKASRPLPHQCNTPKAMTEVIKEVPSPGSSTSSSPGSQRGHSDSTCRSPGSASHCSSMNSRCVLSASSLQPPRSMSRDSCELNSNQGQRVSPSIICQRSQAALEGPARPELVCSSFSSGRSLYFPEQAMTYIPLFPPQTVKVESVPANMSFTVPGHPVRLAKAPYLSAPIESGVLDSKPPAHCSPLTTSAGAMYPHSEHQTSLGLPLPSVIYPFHTVFMHVPDSNRNGNHSGPAAAVQSSGLDISMTCSDVKESLEPTAQGHHRTQDKPQSDHSAVHGQESER